jgi:peptidoglycan-associated lipoprotein
MTNQNVLALFLLAFAPSLATAQVPAAGDKSHAPEVALEYNYVRSNAPPGQCDCFSLNGGSLSIAKPLGSGRFAGVFDAGFEHGSVDGYDLTLSSFTGGLRYRPLLRPRWNPFGQVLVGVAHASGSLVDGRTPAAYDSALTFASVIGGGLDYRMLGHWTIRAVEGDYLLTTYSNGDNNHQNNLRLSAGVVYRFGRR